MRFWISLVLLAVMFGVIGCDRFDHDFDARTTDTQFENYVTTLGDQMTRYLNNGEIDSLMTLYTSDYSNSGVSLSDMRTFYSGLIATTGNTYTVETNVVSKTSLELYYRISTVAGSAAPIDTTFTDYAQRNGDAFCLYGERSMRMLIEMFTATWCPNCPYAAEAAHELVAQYPGQVIPIEYVTSDPTYAPVDNSDIVSYYLGANISLPTAIFQGLTKIVGGSETTLTQYPTTAAQYLSQTPEINIDNLTCSLSGTTLNYSFDYTGQPTGNSLKLKYAVLQGTTTHNYPNGDALTNVVIARGESAFSGGGSSYTGTMSFTGTLPSDAKFVVWVQNVESTYDSNTCKVYNCAETNIGR